MARKLIVELAPNKLQYGMKLVQNGRVESSYFDRQKSKHVVEFMDGTQLMVEPDDVMYVEHNADFMAEGCTHGMIPVIDWKDVDKAVEKDLELRAILRKQVKFRKEVHSTAKELLEHAVCVVARNFAVFGKKSKEQLGAFDLTSLLERALELIDDNKSAFDDALGNEEESPDE